MDFLLVKKDRWLLLVVLLGWLTCCLSCKESQGENEDPAAFNYQPVEDDTTYNEPFYPVMAYLQGQINHVDTTPIAIEQITRINGKTVDSGYVSKAIFKDRVLPFLTPDPENPSLKASYKETSFFDQSIAKLTFSIEDITQQQILRQADVHLNPENNRVTLLVLKRYISTTDSTVQQYILWEHNMNCQISEQIEKANGLQYSRVTQLIWDRPLE